MRAAPARLVIETFLVSLNALPTKKVQRAVGPDEFDSVIGHAVAALATFDCFVFGHLLNSGYREIKLRVR